MATPRTTAKTATPEGDVRNGETLKTFIDAHSKLFLEENDLLHNVEVGLHWRLVRKLQMAGLDESRMLGLGSSASAAATSVTRHLKVAADLQDTAARALKRAWSEYVKNIQEPVRAAENAADPFEV